MSTPDPLLSTILCGIPLRNPVLAASGTFAYGVEFAGLVKLEALGGLVVKGLSREPIEGNPPPRVVESPAGMINSIGLQNIGVRAFVKEKLPQLARIDTAVFANVFGYEVADYCEVVRILDDQPGVAGYELNVSCPNTSHGGMFFSSDPSLLAAVVRAVRQVAHVFEEARVEQRPMQGHLADRLVVFDRLVIEQAMLAVDHEAPHTIDLPDVATIRFGELCVAHAREQHQQIGPLV